MRQKILGVLAGFLTSAGLSFAQAPVLPLPSPGAAVPGATDSPAGTAAPTGPGVPSMPGTMPFVAGGPFMAPPPPCPVPDCPPTMEGAMGVPVEKQCKPSGCHEPCFWVDCAYILWHVKGPELNVPLVTTGSAAAGQQGRIGAATTQTVVGGDDITLEEFSGVRARAGFCVGCVWLPSLEVGGFCLYRRQSNETVSSNAAGSPVLSRPFFDTVGGAEAAQPFALPGVVSGTFTVQNRLDMWALEVNSVLRICDEQKFSTAFTADILVGARMLKLYETFRTQTNSTLLAAGPISLAGVPGFGAGTMLTSRDQIDARNEFYGGQLGARMEFECGRFALEFSGTMAVGQMFETRGAASRTGLLNNVAVSAPGSILVPNSSAGVQHQSIFALMPEGQVTLRYLVTDWMTINVGYSYLYINKVLRPGGTLNRNIDPAQLATSPTFNPAATTTAPLATDLNQSDLDAYGLHVGVALRF